MLFLNYKEAFQALDRFAMSSDPALRRRFTVLALKVYAMVKSGWQGIEVEEGFLEGTVKTVVLAAYHLDKVLAEAQVQPSDEIEVVILDDGLLEVSYTPRLAS